MTTYIPLISSGLAGPLGVVHLPRLWLKLSLEARGCLDARYPGAGKGFDQMTLDALRLDRESTIAFIKITRPTYPQFEAWVKSQPGVRLDPATIDRHNAAVCAYNHDDATRRTILSDSGLADGGGFRDAVRLNDLESWLEFHTAILK